MNSVKIVLSPDKTAGDLDKALSLIEELYDNAPVAKDFLLKHSHAVAEFAVSIAEAHNLDISKVATGALLHDIGILKCHAPGIGCTGSAHYIAHGILGAKILRKHGYTFEAEVAETHVGVAITAEEIIKQNLPLPHRDFTPRTPEERCIAYADKFFSKRPAYLTTPKPLDVVIKELSNFGEKTVRTFLEWHALFG